MPISKWHAFIPGMAMLIAAAPPALSRSLSVIPDQTSHIRLSNHDVNHVLCVGGDIEDVKFSAEKGLTVERGGADAWIKFLVLETEDQGAKTRSYATSPTEFFIACNGAIYPLYAEPADIPAQTISLLPGGAQRARSNEALLGPLVEEERAVGITLAMLQDHIPASFTQVAPARDPISLSDIPNLIVNERRRLEVEGAGLSVSEYLITGAQGTAFDERTFLNSALGTDIFAITLDRLEVRPGETARLIIVRRSIQP